MSISLCSDSITHPSVVASRRVIELLKLLLLDSRYLSDSIPKAIKILQDCLKNYLEWGRSNCDHPLCVPCQGKKRAILKARTDSAILTFLLGDPLEEAPPELIESRSIQHLVLSPESCEPEDIGSLFGKMHDTIVTVFKRSLLGKVGYIRVGDMTVNNDPGDISYGLCHPHIHMLLAIDTRDEKSRLFWEVKDPEDRISYLRHAFKKNMKLDYLPDIECKTVLTANALSSLVTGMSNAGCKTQKEYSAYIEEHLPSEWTPAITQNSNIDSITKYLTRKKKASKAFMIPDHTLCLDSQKKITYKLLTSLENLRLVESAKPLKLPSESTKRSDLKKLEDYTYLKLL